MLTYRAPMKFYRKKSKVYKYLMMIPNYKLISWFQLTINYNNNY